MTFEPLTKYLIQIQGDDIGTWIIDNKNDGTIEHPIQMPFVNYSVMVHHFIDDVYEFIEKHKDLELNHYGEILNENGIDWGSQSMGIANVSALDARCVLALIVGAVRAERFCDGALLSFFKNGNIEKWLMRLKEIEAEKAC